MVKKIILFFGIAFCWLGLHGQQEYSPRQSTRTYQLGDKKIRIRLLAFGPVKELVFINLHSDETTSVAGAVNVLRRRGGLLIKLENGGERNIRFRKGKKIYTFDPNRIFSRVGIERTLARFKNTSEDAINEVERFAHFLLSLLPPETTCVVALHNNTPGRLSISSYLSGNDLETDARQTHVENEQDPDNFFLTTDSLLFSGLSSAKYNTVWQDNERAKQDGSLSVYFGEKNACYINCETEHGQLGQYEKMLAAAINLLETRRKDPSIRLGR